MKILITGGGGYLGTMLTKKLLEKYKHCEIVCIDSFYHRNEAAVLPFLTDPRYTVRKLDLVDTENCKNLQSFDVVFHLAALVGFPLCEDHKLLSIHTNLEITRHLLENIRKDCLFIYPTTNSGYGITKGDEVCTEETPLNPISLYGKTKKESELLIQKLHENSIRLRLATVFGVSFRLRNDLLINSFVWKAYKDKYNVIYDGKAKRNYIHVQDIADAFIFCLEHRDKMANSVFNVGNDSLNMDKLSLAEKINVLIPHKIVEAEVGVDPDKRNYIVSSKKLYDLGFSCKYDLEFGIKELVKTFRVIDSPVFGNY